ncbi:SLC13 family permease [Halopelagius fulvigenes]|uniref:SLC13 family permease n=1 Tax=Halopelagius fulvigenes TaxID=1198324 RepID=A0ABD5TVX9_9EURY
MFLTAVFPLQPTPDVTVGTVVVFAVVLGALVLFTTELLPVDVTAILVLVSLVVLEPWTRISVEEGLSGFSNEATITVLAMLILSAGVSRSGAVQRLGRRLSGFAGSDRFRQVLATVAVGSVPSGFINNTPVVAMLVPVVSDIAHGGRTSPSKLLIPLSFASQLGGMLTLIGTSTNILASDVAGRLSAQYPRLHEFSMFEFTGLGAIVLLVGGTYLVTVGHRLLPERVPPEESYIEEYEVADYLVAVVVGEDAPVAGRTVAEATEETLADADVLQLVRGGRWFGDPLARKTIRSGDRLRLRTDRDTLRRLMSMDGLSLAETPTAVDFDTASGESTLFEVVIPSRSALVGETLSSSSFAERYDATVLAFRTRGELVHERLEETTIRPGDTLLVQALPDSVDRLSRNRDFILALEAEDPQYETEKIPHAVAVVLAVVVLAAAEILPIVIAALAGVVAMVALGVLQPNELYDAVDWNVIFLLAGVIPLGIALEQTGGAAFVGALVASTAGFLPIIGVLWTFYLATGLITELISNNASVVLMIPVAADVAARIGANPFAFVLAVTFAASTAFLSPIGYQTNLFVFGPGGYKFTDYLRVGLPLQLLLSVVTVVGIVAFWGV